MGNKQLGEGLILMGLDEDSEKTCVISDFANTVQQDCLADAAKSDKDGAASRGASADAA